MFIGLENTQRKGDEPLLYDEGVIVEVSVFGGIGFRTVHDDPTSTLAQFMADQSQFL